MAAGTFHLQGRVRSGMRVVTAGVARATTKQVRRRGALSVALLVPMFVALGMMPASANTGSVSVGQNCQRWHASVALDHNVTPDRTVSVVTTIPGTMGIRGRHYNTSFGPIWSVSGEAPTHGSVTLNVYFPNGRREYTETKALPVPRGCVTTTTRDTGPATTNAPTTTTIVTQGSTQTTSPPATTGPTVPESTTVFAEGVTAAPPSSGPSAGGPAAVSPSGEVEAAAAANALPRTGGGGGPGPVIGLVSLLGGAVMLLVSRHRRGRVA